VISQVPYCGTVPLPGELLTRFTIDPPLVLALCMLCACHLIGDTYSVFFVFGMALYLSLPTLGHLGLAGRFVITVCLILTMYGGGFATVPGYLADIFGTQMVGAIHGRLLTAWSVAGIIGPFLIAAVRQAQINAGVAQRLVYDRTLYILAGLLPRGDRLP
jgi:hypothetical protein